MKAASLMPRVGQPSVARNPDEPNMLMATIDSSIVLISLPAIFSLTYLGGPLAALYLIAMRIAQGVGGATIKANSTAVPSPTLLRG